MSYVRVHALNWWQDCRPPHASQIHGDRANESVPRRLGDGVYARDQSENDLNRAEQGAYLANYLWRSMSRNRLKQGWTRG